MRENDFAVVTGQGCYQQGWPDEQQAQRDAAELRAVRWRRIAMGRVVDDGRRRLKWRAVRELASWAAAAIWAAVVLGILCGFVWVALLRWGE